MYDAVVELNDIDLPIWQSGDSSTCPAFALRGETGLVFGHEARDQARLHPLRINSRFMQQLSLVETPELKPHARHHADLAYRFLQFAHRGASAPERCVFVVPPSYTQDHMSVLLGVVKQCSFDAVGLLDQTVAVASQEAAQSNGVFCDLQLHQLVLGAYHVENNDVVRGATQSVDQFGLQPLYERWVRLIAQAFVKQCRFDPLHDAAIEQQLWLQLPAILQEQANDEMFKFSLLNKYLIEIPRSVMLGPVTELFAQLQQRLVSFDGDNAELLCSARLASLPGFLTLDSRLKSVAPDSVAKAVSNFQSKICSNTANLPFVCRLPMGTPNNAANIAPTAAVNPDPSSSSNVVRSETFAIDYSITHFVLDGVAHPLKENPLLLNGLGAAIVWSHREGSVATAMVSLEEGRWSVKRLDNAELWLNGEILLTECEAVQKGDRLSLAEDGAELSFIRLLA
ncbi:MAG: hypothetical protein AB8B86_13075 [Pseudomonadales bacterium]